ncbi:DNA-binding transcriptional LysR family regulator [Rhodanobacter sp. ANJX3]|jgi:DNA-binding transcriptional LysR family regulator|uniref:LysR family transcriptional regulator n=1 Tax=Rhodanobacter sp. ANJX3 TaxID=2723083 RepID=UPI0017F73967|nr:LysR family transcriptional regulator [Rhodanobacter sp. ANJX3]MBB5360037.1 DNA-binding transcriptional LysR family regulator [Rhodanobacter sp. ANJX3]
MISKRDLQLPFMQSPDLNLLFALDVLLEEGSVVGAARRMNLSAPAMSRTLARIREAVGDPIFVKVGRRMVPTPRALAMHEQVHSSAESARQLLKPEREVDLSALKRHFNLHANDTFISAFGQALLSRVRREAPHVLLRFSPESESEDMVLRDGKVDLYISAMRSMGAEVHVQTLFTTKFVGLARDDHPIFQKEITPERFALYDQISVSRRGRATGPIDTSLQALGLSRQVSLVVPTFHSGVFMLETSDLILALPEHVAWAVQRMGIRARAFSLPLPLETVVIVQGWHPRFQSDGAHRWLRRIVREICTAGAPIN